MTGNKSSFNGVSEGIGVLVKPEFCSEICESTSLQMASLGREVINKFR